MLSVLAALSAGLSPSFCFVPYWSCLDLVLVLRAPLIPLGCPRIVLLGCVLVESSVFSLLAHGGFFVWLSALFSRVGSGGAGGGRLDVLSVLVFRGRRLRKCCPCLLVILVQGALYFSRCSWASDQGGMLLCRFLVARLGSLWGSSIPFPYRIRVRSRGASAFASAFLLGHVFLVGVSAVGLLLRVLLRVMLRLVLLLRFIVGPVAYTAMFPSRHGIVVFL